MSREQVRKSKFLSLVLRHDPGRIDLSMDAAGWAVVADVLAGAREAGVSIGRDELDELVATNSKQRFELSEDGGRIRARQGHSVEVDLGLEPVEPPEHLFHGTSRASLEPIRERGLEPRGRQHVHLSADAETARMVGQRHGRPIVLTIRAGSMQRGGHEFWRSTNGVWLARAVPVGAIVFPGDEAGE